MMDVKAHSHDIMFNVSQEKFWDGFIDNVSKKKSVEKYQILRV